MTTTTTPTSGAADLPEALKHAEGLESFAEHLPAYGFDSKPLKEAAATIRRLHALLESEDAAHCNTISQRDEAEKLGTMLASAVAEHFRVEVGEYSNLNDPRLVALEILGGGYVTDSDTDRKLAALAAGQATETQGVAYAALPDLDDTLWLAIGQHRRAITTVETSAAAKAVDAAVRKLLHAFADATCALRASHGQAPAGAVLPAGWVPLTITLEGQFSEEVAYGPQIMMDRLGKWLGKYFAQAAQADSVQEDAARYRWLRDQHWNESQLAVVQNPKRQVRLGTFCPSGRLLDDIVDAARKQGGA